MGLSGLLYVELLLTINLKIPNIINHKVKGKCKGKGKGKAIPLQAWTGPEGSWRLKLPDFKTIGT